MKRLPFTNETLADLGAKQYISTKANFKGRVSIPEVKDANSPILWLTSEDLYLAGKVNEKDLTKISVGQKLTSVSNNVVVDGSILTSMIILLKATAMPRVAIQRAAQRCLVIASWPI